MSDSKLRELERRWRETGSVEDEVAYLRERVRAGDLKPELLKLAVYCGHSAAELAAGYTEDQSRYIDGPGRRNLWFREPGVRFGREVAVRTAIALIEAALPAWESETRWQRLSQEKVLRFQQAPRRALAALRVALVSGEQPHIEPDPLWYYTGQLTDAGVLAGRLFSADENQDDLLDRLCGVVRKYATEAHLRDSVKKDLLTWALA